MKMSLAIGNDGGLENIGAGVEISSSFLSVTLAMYENKPSLFMKRLVYDSGVFDMAYVASCSLTGYVTHLEPPGAARPALDPIKFAAMKGN
jgi:hypothetical protein